MRTALTKYGLVTVPHPNTQANDAVVILLATNNLTVKPLRSVLQPEEIMQKKWKERQ